jgi:AraC-like DNA-binding protein
VSFWGVLAGQAGLTIAAVAAAVGFADQSHMIKRFRLAYGITPRQYAAPAR